MVLTFAQHSRLEKLAPEAKVIGLDRKCPLVEYPDGKINRIMPNGRMTPPSIGALDKLIERQI